jgi:hypothetical protein
MRKEGQKIVLSAGRESRESHPSDPQARRPPTPSASAPYRSAGIRSKPGGAGKRPSERAIGIEGQTVAEGADVTLDARPCARVVVDVELGAGRVLRDEKSLSVPARIAY